MKSLLIREYTKMDIKRFIQVLKSDIEKYNTMGADSIITSMCGELGELYVAESLGVESTAKFNQSGWDLEDESGKHQVKTKNIKSYKNPLAINHKVNPNGEYDFLHLVVIGKSGEKLSHEIFSKEEVSKVWEIARANYKGKKVANPTNWTPTINTFIKGLR